MVHFVVAVGRDERVARELLALAGDAAAAARDHGDAVSRL
jgi:hypothetical protein